MHRVGICIGGLFVDLVYLSRYMYRLSICIGWNGSWNWLYIIKWKKKMMDIIGMYFQQKIEAMEVDDSDYENELGPVPESELQKQVDVAKIVDRAFEHVKHNQAAEEVAGKVIGMYLSCQSPSTLSELW